QFNTILTTERCFLTVKQRVFKLLQFNMYPRGQCVSSAVASFGCGIHNRPIQVFDVCGNGFADQRAQKSVNSHVCTPCVRGGREQVSSGVRLVASKCLASIAVSSSLGDEQAIQQCARTDV